MRWRFWDATAYSCLYTVALLEAVEEFIKPRPAISAHLPAVMTGDVVGYVPLLLITVASAIFIAKHWPWRAVAAPAIDNKKALPWADPYPFIKVIEQTFRNERVEVDGHSYLRCKFENVTFVLNGTAPFELQGCHFMGTRWVQSTNPIAEIAWALAVAVGLVNDSAQIDARGGLVERPTRGDPVA